MVCLAQGFAISACVSPLPPSPEPSASSADSEGSPEDELGAIAWWATESLGFGVIPEAPPDPNPPAQPEGFRQLTVGTLDGRVTAVLALHWDWAHSYVAGPYGTDVLVTNDTGTASEVYLISALDGARTDLFSSPDLIAAAAIGDGGRSVYYVERGRAGGLDRGLWRRTIGGAHAPIQVLAGPLTEEMEDPRVWWITADPLEGRVVVQACFGEVRCTTRAVDPVTGVAEEETVLGWPLGADATTFFANGLGAADAAYAWNLATGATDTIPGAFRSVPVRVGNGWRFVRGEPNVPEGATEVVDPDGGVERVPGADAVGSVLEHLGERRGVALPEGWVLRWPPTHLQELEGAMGPPGDWQMIDIRTGRRVDLTPVEPAIPLGAPCEVPVPSAMPNGQPPGFAVVELVDGTWTVRWGPMAGAVVLKINSPALAQPGEPDDRAPVEVRGHAGRAMLIGDEGIGMPAITWTEGDCSYTVSLPAGTTLEQMISYAAAF